jgi:Fe-S-cluster containining protein
LASLIFNVPGYTGEMTGTFEMHERAHEVELIEKEWDILEPGTRWKCIRCSWCCKRPWAVNLTWWEYERLKNDPRAGGMDIDRVEVDPDSGLTHPYFVIDGKCPALIEEGAVCGLYPDWPYTCATYPFLLMNEDTIRVHSKCKGFGHGDVIDLDEMRTRIMSERTKAGMLVEKD